MKKEKAVFVTVLITVMLLVIMIGLLLLGAKIAFFIIGAAFALIGVVCAAIELFDWLCHDDEKEILEPVDIISEDAGGEDVDLTYEAIREAVRTEINRLNIEIRALRERLAERHEIKPADNGDIEKLRRENKELIQLHQLDLAEVTYWRRKMGVLLGE